MTHRAPTKKWSLKVTESSDALDLEDHVFAKDERAAIARSLKYSAEASKRRKTEPFRSAMSMRVFYINRAGKELSPERRKALEEAKNPLRQFVRPAG
jgi:hypothetical protein